MGHSKMPQWNEYAENAFEDENPGRNLKDPSRAYGDDGYADREMPPLQEARYTKDEMKDIHKRLDKYKFCVACNGEGTIIENQPISKFSKVSRAMTVMCEKCNGEGMIQEEEKYHNIRWSSSKDKEKAAAEEQCENDADELEPETPTYSLDTQEDIEICEVKTAHGTHAVAKTARRWVRVVVQLPRVSSAAEIDAEVVENEILEVEVPGVYWLELTLPHTVDDEAMECTFNKEDSALIVRVPVAATAVTAES